MDKVKVALTGAVSMANAVHYPSLVEFEDVEIVAHIPHVSYSIITFFTLKSLVEPYS